jgi:endonuclease
VDTRFEEWMVTSGADDGTIRSSLSTVRRIESAYGDIDEHYDIDRCQSILSELTYTKNDVRANAANPSNVTINGDLYSGLASLRTHLAKYVRYRDEFDDIDFSEVEASPSAVLGAPNEATFSLERDLQSALRSSIEQLESDLVIIDGGMEYTVPSGRIDILAQDSRGARVVIELKAVKATRDAVGQTLAYMGDLAAEGTSEVRGILVAPAFDERSIAAARVVPSLHLVEYRFSFVFNTTS